MKTPVPLIVAWLLTLATVPDLTSAQVLTHGPMVGGVTASEAKVFGGTDQSAAVALRYGSHSKLRTYQVSEAFVTS